MRKTVIHKGIGIIVKIGYTLITTEQSVPNIGIIILTMKHLKDYS